MSLNNLRNCLPVLLITAGLTINSPSAPVPPAEKLLPADTVFVLSSPDCSQLKVLYQKSPATQMWQDAAMKPFREKFMAKWEEEIVKPLERQLGIKLNDYAAMMQGQLTFAVTLEGWDGQNDKRPATLLLLDAKDQSGLLATNLTKLRRQWVDAGKTLRTEIIRGVEFAVVTLATNDLPKSLMQLFPQRQTVREAGQEADKPSPAKPELLIGQHESVLIVGSAASAVEKVVSRLTGGTTPVLAEQALFEANRLAVFRAAPMFGWLHTKKLMDLLAALPEPTPNPDAPSLFPTLSPRKIITALGLSALHSIAMAYRDAGDGGLYEVFLSAPEASRQGLTRLLSPDPRDSNPPPFVPADAVKFQRWRMDLQAAIATAEKMVGEITPEAISTWNFVLKNGSEAVAQQEPSFDIRKDLFGNLGNDVIMWEKSPRGTSLEQLNAAPSIFLVGSPAPERLAAAMKAILVLVSPGALTPKEREFLGRKIFTVDLPGRSASGLNYAASAGYLALGTDAALIEEFLRSSDGQAKALRDKPGLADAAQKVGGQNTGHFGYENQVETMRVAFELMKKIGSAQAGGSTPDFNPFNALPFARPESSFKEWMDFSLLPEFSAVAKYFHFAVFAGQANAEGIRYRFFTPNPPPVATEPTPTSTPKPGK